MLSINFMCWNFIIKIFSRSLQVPVCILKIRLYSIWNVDRKPWRYGQLRLSAWPRVTVGRDKIAYLIKDLPRTSVSSYHAARIPVRYRSHQLIKKHVIGVYQIFYLVRSLFWIATRTDVSCAWLGIFRLPVLQYGLSYLAKHVNERWINPVLTEI